MDIITRFVTAGWDITIHNDKHIIFIYANKNGKELIADGITMQEAKKVLCFLNHVELSILEQV